MTISEIDWGQVVNGGAGIISLYLATQIRLVVKNHEVRIHALETKPKRKRKSSKTKKPGGH
jgi:hypothetical protein